jgi:ABC-2 type transport system ATP-binding protein
MPQPGIVVENLTKTYRGGKVRALDGVSLSVSPGEVFGVIGPNGAGKTTLFGCILGFLFPDAGAVRFDGRSPDDLGVHAAVGYLPERLNFDRWMTGREFLHYHHALARCPEPEREADVRGLLDLAGLDAAAAGRKIRNYSRGMLQRLGFAQALVGRPRYLFLDEPTSGMDPVGAVMVRRTVAELKSRGVTVLINSHQLEQIERLCDRVAFVKEGRVESIEVMAAGAGLRRELRVRVVEGGFGRVPAETLSALAVSSGGELLEVAESAASFSVPDDTVAARLIEELVKAGCRIVEAVPGESGLERLFFRDKGCAEP